MADTRIRLSLQAELSAAPGSIIVTNGSNEAEYTGPGTNGDVLTVVAGVPTWQAPTFSDFDVSDGTTTQTIAGGDTLTFDADGGVAGAAPTNSSPLQVIVTATDTVTYTISPGTNGQILITDGSGDVVWADQSSVINFDITDGVTTEGVSDGEAITFADGDGIDNVVSAPRTVTTSVTITEDNFDIAVGSATVTLAGTPNTALPIQVTRNGLTQREGGTNDYTIAASVITFNTALIIGETVTVYYWT